MGIQLKVPSLGESVTQATIGAWLKQEGDLVRADEPVVEVESEKATVALPAPAAGVLRKILKPTGATVAVGEVIAEMEADGKAAAVQPPAPPGKAPAPPASARPAPAPPSPPAARPSPPGKAPAQPSPPG